MARNQFTGTVLQYTARPNNEFTGGLSRMSMQDPDKHGGGLEGRLKKHSSLYRQSAPSYGNLAASPGIPNNELKKHDRQGVNYFSVKASDNQRGTGNGTNTYTGSARSAATDNNDTKGQVGKPGNVGFICGKQLSYALDNTDYGNGDPKKAADASFYRQNMNIDRYADKISFTNSRGTTTMSSTRNSAYIGGNNSGTQAGGA